MDYELMGGDARAAVIAETGKRGMTPFLPPVVAVRFKAVAEHWSHQVPVPHLSPTYQYARDNVDQEVGACNLRDASS